MYKMHGNHVATCLCCDDFFISYDKGWSDVTPGEGLQIECFQSKWFLNQRDGLAKFHECTLAAQTCDDYKER